MTPVRLHIRSLFVFALPLLAILTCAAPVRSQTQDLTLSLGGTPGHTRTLQGAAGTADIAADPSLGINYGRRFVGFHLVDFYGEFALVAFPNRPVSASNAVVPQEYASLYLTPGVRVKFFPHARLSPWAAVGGGYALYQQSASLSNGLFATDKFVNRGVFEYGGGLDFRLIRFLGLRAEVRDFFSGNPNLNNPLVSGTQHNLVASGGLIFRF